ncbi:Clr5 domain-containing protein [Xylariaceae sp. FL0255]|nr:Clr5 domain-containing protein [Xylariaceae sp. FL0255]
MPSHAMSIDNLCISDVQDDYGNEYGRHPSWATPEDWDAHQGTIRRLYLDEKRPLKDVVVIMESEYGFRATAKMYKTRLAKWKMLKNRPRGSGH